MIPTHAISIRQPWAEYIVRGLKDYEFRSWGLPERWVGEWLCLHASAQMDLDRRWWELPDHRDLALKAIVGIVRFGRPERFWVDGSAVAWRIDEDGTTGDAWHALGDVPGCPTWCDLHGSWSAWPILEAHAITPIPCPGTIFPRVWPIAEHVDRDLWRQFRSRPDLPALAEPPLPGPLDLPLPFCGADFQPAPATTAGGPCLTPLRAAASRPQGQGPALPAVPLSTPVERGVALRATG